MTSELQIIILAITITSAIIGSFLYIKVLVLSESEFEAVKSAPSEEI